MNEDIFGAILSSNNDINTIFEDDLVYIETIDEDDSIYLNTVY